MKNSKGLRVDPYLCLFPGIFLVVSGTMLLLTSNAAKVIFDLQDLDSALALAMGAIVVMLVLTR